MTLPMLDPLLKYLAAYLPPPLYSIVITLLSRSFSMVTSIARLWNLVLFTDWNTQAFLPAIISILAAYLALASLYRTTTWVLRTIFWFIKWATIISILLTGASYITGNDAAVGDRGIIPNISRYMANMVNGDQGFAEDWRRVRSRQGKRSRGPNAWESFQHHRERQYQEANDGRVEGQHLMTIIAEAADHVLGKSEWWAAAKSVWSNSEEEGKFSKNTKSSSKPPPGSSRSR